MLVGQIVKFHLIGNKMRFVYPGSALVVTRIFTRFSCLRQRINHVLRVSLTYQRVGPLLRLMSQNIPIGEVGTDEAAFLVVG